MRAIGVRADRLVVAYDAATSQAAARLWWLLTDAGHPGCGCSTAGWRRGSRGPAHRVRTGSGGGPRGLRRPARAAPPGDRGGDRGGLADGSGPLLVDVRAPERFSGETEPIDPVAGHIPGAVNLPATGNHDRPGASGTARRSGERYAARAAATRALLRVVRHAAQSRWPLESPD
jgi:thiosulfate/3-mercaptopyruvate sulfurtransferase